MRFQVLTKPSGYLGNGVMGPLSVMDDVGTSTILHASATGHRILNANIPNETSVQKIQKLKDFCKRVRLSLGKM